MITLGDPIPGLVCRTPSPDPVRHASPVLQYSDELLRLLKSYYETTFGLGSVSGTSSVNPGTDLSVSIRCYRQLDQARIMIAAENMAFGFKLLNQALDGLRHLVRTQDATLLFYLFDVALAFDQSYPELAFAVLRHTYDILLITFGHGHPLVWLLRRLNHSKDEDRYDVSATILDGVVGIFKQSSSDDRILKRLDCHYFLLLDYLGLNGIRANVSFPVIDLTSVDDADVAYLARFADRLTVSEDLDEAELKLAMVHTWVQDPLNQQHQSWPELQLSYYRSKLHISLTGGEWDESMTVNEFKLQHHTSTPRLAREEELKSSTYWSDFIHVAGRLLSYKQAVEMARLVSYTWPQLFDEFEVCIIPSSSRISNVLPTLPLSAEIITRRMTSDERLLSRYLEQLQALSPHNLNNDIEKAWLGAPRPIVHAEILVYYWLENT
ncbi:hypothetical protein B0T10DRAFT_465643 [Thelonectria olida]|uniref:Uncharacterized protein n=1 Tax=Thelonectria olida TaxID=1576542 RepID=A0A9P8VT89_9HYPO|nr:hypothetical protein B0T10DRAFT_465643 [Thelonectria olida]